METRACLPFVLVLGVALTACAREKPLACKTETLASGVAVRWPDSLAITRVPADPALAAVGLQVGEEDLFAGKGAAPLEVKLFHRPLAMFRLCQNATAGARPVTQCMSRVPETQLLLVVDFPRAPAFEQDSLLARTERAAQSLGKQLQRCGT